MRRVIHIYTYFPPMTPSTSTDLKSASFSLLGRRNLVDLRLDEVINTDVLAVWDIYWVKV